MSTSCWSRKSLSKILRVADPDAAYVASYQQWLLLLQSPHIRLFLERNNMVASQLANAVVEGFHWQSRSQSDILSNSDTADLRITLGNFKETKDWRASGKLHKKTRHTIYVEVYHHSPLVMCSANMLSKEYTPDAADTDYDSDEWLERYGVEAQDMSEHGEEEEDDDDNEGDSDLDNNEAEDNNSEGENLGAGDNGVEVLHNVKLLLEWRILKDDQAILMNGKVQWIGCKGSSYKNVFLQTVSKL